MNYDVINQYLIELVKYPDPILKEMEKRAKKDFFPIVGPVAGNFLYQIAKLKKPEVVFELGSGFGYSAMWIALALPEYAEIHLTDYHPEHLKEAKSYFEKSKVKARVLFHEGDAIENFKRFEKPVDFVFMDIEKSRYPEALEIILQKLRSGGVLIADNMFRRGLIFGKDKDGKTEAILRFTRMIFDETKFVSTIIPIRDGLSFSIKR